MDQTYNNVKINVDVDVKQILVVGFDDYSYILLNENKEDLGYYRFKAVDNSFKAYRWLEKQIANRGVFICF